MSIFGKPYRTDKEMEVDERDRKKKAKYDARKIKLELANDIYKNVVEEIESGKKEWTKKEMIETVRGEGKFNLGEWTTWGKYCEVAIGKIRRRYWNVEKGNEAVRQMFNYVRYKGKYMLVPFDDQLKTLDVYEGYYQKMKGYQKKDKEIKGSTYGKILALPEAERKSLLKELREKELLNGGEK